MTLDQQLSKIAKQMVKAALANDVERLKQLQEQSRRLLEAFDK
jgi:hypothetical protein